ncbi:hypothetical protein PHSC3_001638 [Chlamydiales bacterium STE3]|nr:hypothetical protein PHSC3_001638 [Chlamydiales bacterium STE3]
MGTELEGKSFVSLKNERSETDWVHCWIKNQQFEGACGAENLEEMLQIFINWVEVQKEN